MGVLSPVWVSSNLAAKNQYLSKFTSDRYGLSMHLCLVNGNLSIGIAHCPKHGLMKDTFVIR